LLDLHREDDKLLTDIYVALDGRPYTGPANPYGRKYLSAPIRIKNLRTHLRYMTRRYADASNELTDLKAQIQYLEQANIQASRIDAPRS
ncbi:MAG: hypothetical protein MN733_23720, partial [Nitrososphaera sp.]|nr:hypothetical protein [Nitrososphaera sp.]